MEGLAALSIVASIFQVVDFSFSVLSRANKIRQSGATDDNVDLGIVAGDLSTLCDRLKQSLKASDSVPNLSQDELDLERLAEHTCAIATELTGLLNANNSSGGQSRFQSFALAIRSTWDEKKILRTMRRLELVRSELSFHVLVSIKIDLDMAKIQQDDRLATLDDASRKIIQAITENRQIQKAELQVQTKELRTEMQTGLIEAFDTFDARARSRHEELLSAVSHSRSQNRTDHPPVTKTSPKEVRQQTKSRLRFNQIHDRFEDVVAAHEATFKWIFTDSERCSFASWMSQDHGIYWICGKAGSGKSTLMKLISTDEAMDNSLKSWAGNRPLLKLSFFFWRNGTDLQRSCTGLLRSLLYQTIEAQEDLCETLFPHMFDAYLDWEHFPSFHDLRRAFGMLMDKEKIPFNLALFIDGLDEYESPEMGMDELAELFKTASNRPNMRIVLSGRPIRILEKSFEICPSLRLEKLTEPDILAFVHAKIKGNPDLTQAVEAQSDLTDELIQEIVSSASGVFLWVRLVVQSLVEGFQNYDTISILQSRLRELPVDLEKLFMHMLKQVPGRYQVQSSQIFRLMAATQATSRNKLLNPSTASHIVERSPLDEADSEDYVLAASDLFFGLQPFEIAMHDFTLPITLDEIQKMVDEIEIRLKVCCAGLLELRQVKPSWYDYIPDVYYLHRSVADFLNRPEIWAQVVQPSMLTDFNEFHRLLQASALGLVRLDLPRCDGSSKSIEGILDASLDTFTGLVRLSERCTAYHSKELLERFDSALSIVLRVYQPVSHWSNYVLTFKYLHESKDSLLTFALAYGFKLFVKEKFQQHGQKLIEQEAQSLLEYACLARRRGPIGILTPEIIEILVSFGADPNKPYPDAWHTWRDTSPWQKVLYLRQDWRISELSQLTMVEMFIENGADPNAYIEYGGASRENGTDNSPPDELPGSSRRKRASTLHLFQEKRRGPDTTRDEKFKSSLRSICQMLEQRGAKRRKWHHDSDNDNWVLTKKSDDADRCPLWYDVDGSFVPKFSANETQTASEPKRLVRGFTTRVQHIRQRFARKTIGG